MEAPWQRMSGYVKHVPAVKNSRIEGPRHVLFVPPSGTGAMNLVETTPLLWSVQVGTSALKYVKRDTSRIVIVLTFDFPAPRLVGMEAA